MGDGTRTLAVQGGLAGLHHQDVGGVLGDDQPVGVLALGVERVGRHYGEVQAVQQRPQLGDLAGGGLDVGLGEDRAAGAASRWAAAGMEAQ